MSIAAVILYLLFPLLFKVEGLKRQNKNSGFFVTYGCEMAVKVFAGSSDRARNFFDISNLQGINRFKNWRLNWALSIPRAGSGCNCKKKTNYLSAICFQDFGRDLPN